MSMRLRQVVLVVTAVIGLFVGGWAASAPRSFYDAFPGLGRIWVAVDGPFNEHLVRDVGALYLALAAAGLVAAATRSVAASRAVGAAWVVFSVPHLVYHAGHLAGFGLVDQVGQVVSLSSTIILGLPLLLPDRQRTGSPDPGSPRPGAVHATGVTR
jgi:hypothetical protein